MIRLGLLPFHALLLLAILLPGCATRPAMLNGFTVGFSTPRGNEIWVREAVFDESWVVHAGIGSCCWREAGAMTGIGPGPMPTSVRVRWDDESRGVTYEAQTELPEDLTERALDLPGYTHKTMGPRDHLVYLIIGLRDDGSMVVWLSNNDSDAAIEGRVLDVVGTAEGRVVRNMLPEERSSSGD